MTPDPVIIDRHDLVNLYMLAELTKDITSDERKSMARVLQLLWPEFFRAVA